MALPPDTESVLSILAAAKGPKALAESHSKLRSLVSLSRKAFRKSPEGQLAGTYMAAMEIWDSQKADGVSLEERQEGFEKSMRASWLRADREWKYLCHDCNDYGLMMRTCEGHPRCGCNSKGHEHLPHEYGIPCHCGVGARFRERAKPTPENFTDAAKKPRGFSKIGRT